jgi:hypothetical protein
MLGPLYIHAYSAVIYIPLNTSHKELVRLRSDELRVWRKSFGKIGNIGI